MISCFSDCCCVLLHYFDLKKSAAETHRLLAEIYGESAPSETVCRNWFRRFKSGVTFMTNKAMLCIWWDMEGVVYYELLKPNETITTEHYRQQLERLNDNLMQKRPSIVSNRRNS